MKSKVSTIVDIHVSLLTLDSVDVHRFSTIVDIHVSLLTLSSVTAASTIVDIHVSLLTLYELPEPFRLYNSRYSCQFTGVIGVYDPLSHSTIVDILVSLLKRSGRASPGSRSLQ